VPGGVPSLPYLLFLPACAGGLAYVVGALGRVHGGAWWAIVLRRDALGGGAGGRDLDDPRRPHMTSTLTGARLVRLRAACRG
jgi:hypothetical protein